MVSMHFKESWCCDNIDCGNVKTLSSRDEMREATKSSNQYVLARHGAAEQNIMEIFGGYPPPKEYALVESGILVVEQSAREISEACDVDLIFSSPLLRTQETSQIISKANGDAEIFIEDRLRERYHGEYEGKKVEELFATHPDSKEYFQDVIGGIENFTKIQRRSFGCVKDLELKYSDKTIVIVSHGDPTWLLKRAFEGWTIDEAMEVKGTYFLPPGKFVISDFGHFPFNDKGELDFSRPYINEVTFLCAECEEGVMRLM